MIDKDRAWLDCRNYPDLDPRVERAVRLAGLHFPEDAVAEAHLLEAATLAPGHEVVLVAYYKYYLYKHRFVDALPYARSCLELGAERLGVAKDPLQVTAEQLGGAAFNEDARYWMFACQALGYVYLRAGQVQTGEQLLWHLRAVDVGNQTCTVELCQVISAAGHDDDDDDD